MSIKPRKEAIGFAQEIPGGHMFEIGNGAIHRRIHCISGRVGTTSLVNVVNGEEYLDETNSEFQIEVTGGGQKGILEAKDFTLYSYETLHWSDRIRTLKLSLETTLNDVALRVHVCYEVEADQDFIRKWLEIEPCDLEGFVITGVTMENLRFKDMVEGVTPKPRYPKTYARGEDNVHEQPDNADTSSPDTRFAFGEVSRGVLTFWGYGEGLYFFTESLLGEETFYRPNGLTLRQREYVPVARGLQTGKAVIGAYVGQPEIGFKRLNEHLMDHWCVIKDKSAPVAWNTWLVTLDGNRPLHDGYNRELLVEYLDHMREAGFYDVLRLDFGWESGLPFRPDHSKFPNGLVEIVRRARDVAGVDMAYWVNPFSSNYWKSNAEEEYGDCLVPGKVSSRSGGNAICVLSRYFGYVREHMTSLASDFGARLIYWDGADWNIPDCSSRHHDHRDNDQLKVAGRKQLAEICESAHAARQDLIIAGFNLPFDNHRLCALDQEQVSDTFEFPTVKSELIHRQQLYQAAFEHPYKAIYGSWYGIDWLDAGAENLKRRPMRELIHACMSVIGNGLAQAGGSFDLATARPEFLDFIKKLFAFRKRFERYFDVYQHVLGFPDGQRVDGEGHILDGSGFIVLVNPTETEQSVAIPLDEPELELDSSKKHVLTDWTSLDRGVTIGDSTAKDPPAIDLAPLDVRYIGVNVA